MRERPAWRPPFSFPPPRVGSRSSSIRSSACVGPEFEPLLDARTGFDCALPAVEPFGVWLVVCAGSELVPNRRVPTTATPATAAATTTTAIGLNDIIFTQPPMFYCTTDLCL